MGLYVTNTELGYFHGDAPELDRKLRDGDGIAWQGDPSLSLSMGVLIPKRGKHKGQIKARRYEVWRHTEDGEDVMIGHWRLEEFDRILLDLIQMDPRSRGHVPVEEQIDKANTMKEREASDKFHDAYGEMLEHANKLFHDRHEPGNVFRGIPGQRDTAAV